MAALRHTSASAAVASCVDDGTRLSRVPRRASKMACWHS